MITKLFENSRFRISIEISTSGQSARTAIDWAIKALNDGDYYCSDPIDSDSVELFVEQRFSDIYGKPQWEVIRPKENLSTWISALTCFALEQVSKVPIPECTPAECMGEGGCAECCEHEFDRPDGECLNGCGAEAIDHIDADYLVDMAQDGEE